MTHNQLAQLRALEGMLRTYRTSIMPKITGTVPAHILSLDLAIDTVADLVDEVREALEAQPSDAIEHGRLRATDALLGAPVNGAASMSTRVSKPMPPLTADEIADVNRRAFASLQAKGVIDSGQTWESFGGA